VVWSGIPSSIRRINNGAYVYCKAGVQAIAIGAICGAGRGILYAVGAGNASSGIPYFAAGLVILLFAFPLAVRLRRLRRLRDLGDLRGCGFLSAKSGFPPGGGACRQALTAHRSAWGGAPARVPGFCLRVACGGVEGGGEVVGGGELGGEGF
jgi:hypothetical protein